MTAATATANPVAEPGRPGFWHRYGAMRPRTAGEILAIHGLFPLGVAGFGASLDELRDAVTRIAEGGTALDPEVVRQLIGARRDPLAALTPREREVLGLMAEGRSNGATARLLFIGVGAVEKHIGSIFAKLGLDESEEGHRRVRAVLAWLERGE